MTAGDAVFDFSRAPFRLSPEADPRQVAEEMIACFRAAAGLPQKVSQCFRATIRVAGFDAQDPLATAGGRIAADIDTGTGAGEVNPYHNRQHFCEVLLSALCLSRLAALAPREQAQLLLAALVHDFHHDGRGNKDVPFRLEKLAIAAAQPYLQAAGVTEDERARIAAIVMATEVSTGVPFGRQCYRYFFEGGNAPPAATGDLPKMLAQDARLALQAVLLTEADVLPSVGLTVDYAELSQENLSREWGRPLNAADKLFFLEHVFQDFVASRFFSPNFENIKRAMAQHPSVRDGNGHA
jgi:hypothetical protein